MDYARSRLVVADATGRVVRRLRPGGTFPRPDPVWSPDGRWVAQLAGGRGGLLEVIPARGGAAREVVGSLSLSTTYYSPTWAPDSRRLAFSMEADAVPAGVDRPSGIYTVAIDGSDLRLLVPRAQMPAYSPDGSKLAYVLDGDVVVSNADGTNARRVTQTAAPEDRPAWSPDGRLLAFSRVVRSRSVIVVARSNGTRARITVSSRRYHASLPSWRPASPLPQARRPACA